jgi:hypothetical protein
MSVVAAASTAAGTAVVSAEATIAAPPIDASQVNASQSAADPVVVPPLPPRTPLSFQNDLPDDAPIALVMAAAQEDASADLLEFGRLLRAEDLPQGFPQSDFLADGPITAEYSDVPPPNDYLASSEELLRSLAEEEATVAAERNILEGLLTPFGVGSMLLMLLGSGMFGYLIMNPASLNAVKDLAMKVAVFRSRPNPTAAPTESVDVDGGATAAANDSGLSNSPALDSNEFFDLSLGNISALRTRPGGSMMLSQPNSNGASPLQQLDGRTTPPSLADKAAQKPADNQANVVITGLTPINAKPITPPAPRIAPSSSAQSASGNGFFSGDSIRVSPAPRPAPRHNTASLGADRPKPVPAPSYQPPASYIPPTPATLAPLPPATAIAPVPSPSPVSERLPEPQGDYRLVTPYTNDAALEAAQQSDPNASFRNLDDGAYIQYGGSYSSKSAAQAKAAQLRNQGVNVEIK